MLQLGNKWLDVAQDNDEIWSVVWTILWKQTKGEELESLVASARTWLRHSLDEADEDSRVLPGWSYVWLPVYSKRPEDNELFQLGSDCLEVIEDNDKQWSVVWSTLWKQAKGEELESLVGSARAWLRHSLDRVDEHSRVLPEWLNVWYKLDKKNYIDEEMLSLVEKWLMFPAIVDKPEWPKICENMLNHGKCGTILVEKCRHSLEMNKDGNHYKDPWDFIYIKLLKHHMTEEEKDLVTNKLFEDSRWPYVWKAMWNPEKPERQLEEDARNWLDQNLEDQSGLWIGVWVKIWDAKPGDEQVKIIGKKWIKTEGNIDNKGFASVYLRIGEHSTAYKDSFLERGYQYLKTMRKSHNKWDKLWKFLWDQEYKQDQLAMLKEK